MWSVIMQWQADEEMFQPYMFESLDQAVDFIKMNELHNVELCEYLLTYASENEY